MKTSISKKLYKDEITLVAPDAGATKKVDTVAKHFGGLEVIQGYKKRDTATGAITGIGFMGDVKGKDLLIVDDLCDAGGTFIGLGMKLKDAGAKAVGLYVSHGIFSKGIGALLNSCIDEIYTTVSFETVNGGIGFNKVEWI